ncbi:hypothetical protein ACFU6R_08680 [Streptomyces sp. NPDC057499]|uniref:hypothetical protein n=1 Tax=Streptomyces sp. NPDC057499 TaxID=3346150 RepID=UPI0036D0111B
MDDGRPGGDPAAGRPRRRWPWVLMVVVLALTAGGAAAVVLTAAALSRDGTRARLITYRVTGTAEDVTVTYPSWQAGGLSAARLRLRTLPWTGETRTRGFMSGGSFTVTLGASGGEASCTVRVDGGPVRAATASGAFATASCDGF